MSSHHHPHYGGGTGTTTATPSHHCPANNTLTTTHLPGCTNQFSNKTHGSLHKSLSFAFQYPAWYNVPTQQPPNEVLAAPCYFQNQMK